RISTKDIVVTMDDDLQHRPSTISTLIGALGQGNDLVYGVPEKGEHAKWRNITSRTAKWILSNTIGAEQARNSSAFRAFRRELSDGWSRVSDPYVSLDVLLSWVTTSHAAIPIPMDERAAGTSNYSFLKLMRHMLNMMTGYSTRPLRLVTLLGFLASFAGLASLFFVIGRWWMTENATPGFAFLASMISVFGGLQLFALGVIGEYLGRMHVRSMSKPAYNVRRSVGIV
ncbi:MAG: glycosyltransferase, partial [Acidimicrobiales bacterium]|nr:glycosyltransferase [Acidimicrobiales bacterium]